MPPVVTLRPQHFATFWDANIAADRGRRPETRRARS
jgi:hypothetical protein